MALNLKKNLTQENFGEVLMIVSAVVAIGLVAWGGIVWQKASRTSAAEIAICKLVKPEFLNPNVCGKE